MHTRRVLSRSRWKFVCARERKKGHPHRYMTHPLEVEGNIKNPLECAEGRCGRTRGVGGFRRFAFGLNSEPERRFRSSPNNRFISESQARVGG